MNQRKEGEMKKANEWKQWIENEVKYWHRENLSTLPTKDKYEELFTLEKEGVYEKKKNNLG